MSHTSTQTQSFWLKYAQQIRRQVNTAWVLEHAELPLCISVFLGGITLICLRLWQGEVSHWGVWLSFVGLLLLSLVVAWCRARFTGKLESLDASLIRLESRLELKSQLSSASSGITEWPEPPLEKPPVITWDLRTPLFLLVGCLVLWSLALYIPVNQVHSSQHVQAPLEWQLLDEHLAQLAEESALDQTYVEQMQEQLDQLQDQPSDDWYDLSSLEAGDSLLERHLDESEQLLSQLNAASNAMESMSESTQGEASQKQALQQQLDSLAEVMERGGLKPNEALRQQLAALDPDAVKRLSAEEFAALQKEMQDLKERIQQQCMECKQCMGREAEMAQRRAPYTIGDEFGEEEDTGPTNRNLGSQANRQEALVAGGLESQDTSVTLPSELIDISLGEHELDESSSRQQAGGKTSNLGSGGGQTWQGNYLPEEKRALKTFFK